MGGPGSGRGKRSFGRISRGGGSRGSRGGRRPTLAQDMTPMEEETHLAEEEENGGQDHSNESDEDDLSCSIENEEGPQKVSLPDGAIPVPLFQQNRWPTWRKKCWSSWHIVLSSGIIVAKCNICNDEGYHSGSKHSFSNFLRHLRKNHEDEYKKASGTKRPNQASLNNYVHRSKKMSVVRKEHLDNLLAEMICKDNLPLTILQREGFQNFMSAAVPEYKIPSYEKNERYVNTYSLRESVSRS